VYFPQLSSIKLRAGDYHFESLLPFPGRGTGNVFIVSFLPTVPLRINFTVTFTKSKTKQKASWKSSWMYPNFARQQELL
jgi:hypothetical protein